MTTTAPADVDAYLAALPTERHDVFNVVRERIHASVAGLGETISYKMPAVTRNGDVVLFFAAWKQHIGIYPIPPFDGPLEARVGAVPRSHRHRPLPLQAGDTRRSDRGHHCSDRRSARRSRESS